MQDHHVYRGGLGVGTVLRQRTIRTATVRLSMIGARL